MSKEDLKLRAIEIRDEVVEGRNTARRVGQLLVDIIAGSNALEIIDSKRLGKILPTDMNIYSALSTDIRITAELEGFLESIDGRYLRKDIDDTAAGNITFGKDIILPGIGASIYSDRDANNFNHKEGFRLWADGTAWLKDLRVKNDSMFAGSLSSPTFASGFPNGTGWMLAPYTRKNAAGVDETKYKLEIDDVAVRGTLRVYEFVISQLLGENDNRIFAGMMEVDHYDPGTGRVYLDTDGGRLYNPFRRGDILMVQQYQGDPSLENDHMVVKQYELKVVAVGVGNPADGEDRLDWLTFENFVGDLSLIGKRDTLCRVDNPDDSTRSGIIKITTVDEFGTPYIDVVRGMKTDPANCVKVRIGNLNGLVTPYFGRLDGDGAYAENLYARGKFILADSGQDVSTLFQVMNGKLSSEMSSVRYEQSEKDNCLLNSSFAADTVGWELGNDVSLFAVRRDFIAVNGGFYAEKDRVTGIVEVSERKALYIKASGVSQPNRNLRKRPEGPIDMPDGSKAWPTHYVSLIYMAKTAGTLTAGFAGAALRVSVALAPGDAFGPLEFSGAWDGTGDFELSYTGEIYVYNLLLNSRPLDDFRLEMGTRLKQTDERIGMYATRLDNLAGTVTDMGLELDNTNGTLSAYVTKTDNLGQYTVDLGLRIDGVGETLGLYATKTDVSGLRQSLESSIELNAYDITQRVSRTDYTGNKVASMINQTATTVTIDAGKIQLAGRVTFSMFDTTTRDKIDDKVEAKDLGSLAWKNTVGKAMLDNTIIVGGYLSTSLINVNDLVVNRSLNIGAFGVNSHKGLTWSGSDYFGNAEYKMGLGGGYAIDTQVSCKSMISAWSNTADLNACLSGIVNGFGVAIYGSTDGWGSNYPATLSKWAGFFSGSVFATGSMRSHLVVSQNYRYTPGFQQGVYSNYWDGISFNYQDYRMDDVRLHVRGGLIVAVTDNNGGLLQGVI